MNLTSGLKRIHHIFIRKRKIRDECIKGDILNMENVLNHKVIVDDFVEKSLPENYVEKYVIDSFMRSLSEEISKRIDIQTHTDKNTLQTTYHCRLAVLNVDEYNNLKNIEKLWNHYVSVFDVRGLVDEIFDNEI